METDVEPSTTFNKDSVLRLCRAVCPASADEKCTIAQLCAAIGQALKFEFDHKSHDSLDRACTAMAKACRIAYVWEKDNKASMYKVLNSAADALLKAAERPEMSSGSSGSSSSGFLSAPGATPGATPGANKRPRPGPAAEAINSAITGKVTAVKKMQDKLSQYRFDSETDEKARALLKIDVIHERWTMRSRAMASAIGYEQTAPKEAACDSLNMSIEDVNAMLEALDF